MNKISFHQAKWNEPLILQMGQEGERGILLPKIEKEIKDQVGNLESYLPKNVRRKVAPHLPQLSQMQVQRHFLRLSQETMGTDFNIDIGLGTCTMKYSPKIHETFVRSYKMTELHPYQPVKTVQGILKIIYKVEEFLKEISGMDAFSLQPTGGSQAIYSNVSVMRAYHQARGEGEKRNEVITTIFSHPANAGAAATAGYKVITLYPDKDGYINLEALKEAVSHHTAGLMITNPEDTGIYNERIKEYVDLVHSVGGLCIYDQANANGLLGLARAKEAGFDMCHFNLHKTFASPHGSQGPGAGAQGVKKFLEKYLPMPRVIWNGSYYDFMESKDSIGKIRKFYGVIPVLLRVYAYIMSLGEEGLKEVAKISILNNNYMIHKMLKEVKGLSLPMSNGKPRVEQARLSFKKLYEDTSITTDDLNRRVIDYGVQDYFTSHHPRIIREPFTPEPVESYSKKDIDDYIKIIKDIAKEAYENPDIVKSAPHNSTIHQVDITDLEDIKKFACTYRAYKKKEL